MAMKDANKEFGNYPDLQTGRDADSPGMREESIARKSSRVAKVNRKIAKATINDNGRPTRMAKDGTGARVPEFAPNLRREKIENKRRKK